MAMKNPFKRPSPPDRPPVCLAMRSERDSEPVLIWPALVPTAMSAMVLSSVSPERCEITAV